MQLTMSLDIFPAPVVKKILLSNLWIDVTPEACMIGFTQKVEASPQLDDALRPLRYEDEMAYEQRLYDAIWLADHYLCLEQRASISFTFDFQRNDRMARKMFEESLRLRPEIREGTALLGLPSDF